MLENDDSGMFSALPVIGLSHSLGGKLTSLFSSTDNVNQYGLLRKANIFLGFNNFGFQQSSASSSSSSSVQQSEEFQPSPQETWRIIEQGYSDKIPSSALIKFADDTIDQSFELKKYLQGDSHTVHIVAGDHLQPNKLTLDENFLQRLNSIVKEIITS